MKISVCYLILLIYLSCCSDQCIFGQDPSQNYQSPDYYLTCNSNLSFKFNVRSFESGRYQNSSEITLDKTIFSPTSTSINEIKTGLKTNINLIFSSEKSLGYINSSNNLMNLDLPNPYPSVKEHGSRVGKFFLGALVGAAVGTATVLIVSSKEETSYTPGVGYSTNGSRDTSMDGAAPWIIAGSTLMGGIMFAIKW
jgi:hypothetical protein